MTKNWSVRTKLFTVIGIVAFLAFLQSCFIIWELSAFTDRASEAVREQEFGIVLARIVEFDERFSRITYAYLDAGSQVTRRNYTDFKATYEKLVEEARLVVSSQVQRERLEKIVMVRAQLFPIEEQALALTDKGSSAEAAELLTLRQYDAERVLFTGLIQNEIVLTKEQIAMFETQRDVVLKNAHWVAYFFLSLLILVGAALSYAVSAAIARTAEEMEEVADAIGRGDASGRVTVNGNDEIARIAIAFNKCAVALDGTSMKRLKQITREVGQ